MPKLSHPLSAYGKWTQLFFIIASALVCSLPFWFFSLDFWAQDFFYCRNADSLWCHGQEPLWDFLYHYGVLPAGALAIISVGIIFLSQKFDYLKKKRLYAVFLIFSLALGPGLIINSFLKMQCGRPRPREITQYQGSWDYKAVGEKGITGKGKSFPCGHCSMGFIFMSFYFIFYRGRKILAYAFLLVGLAWGGLIGMARMSQGGHFFSDVLWSGIVVFFSSWLVYHYILKIPQRELGLLKTSTTGNSRWSLVFSSLIVVAILAGILIATPVFKEYEFESLAAEKDEKNTLTVVCQRCYIKLTVNNTDKIRLKQTAQGFGFPGAKSYHWLYNSFVHNTREYFFNFTLRGFFSELVNNIEIEMPQENFNSLNLKVESGDISLKNLSGKKLLFPVSVELGRDGILQADDSFAHMQQVVP